jgi:Type IV secretion system pilin
MWGEGHRMARVARQLGLASLVFGLLLVATCVPVFAVTSPAINTTITNVTDWVRGILISLGILAFVIGAALYIFDSTVGGQERGKSFMIAAVGGVMLGLLAGPIVTLAASLVGSG